ncbi:methyltransferase domain-containing protein [Methylocella sp.]|uniref:class I SAM-dependent methyltransferase n=1 Tax=Methylocella sp. TaxID=1978226 RepID=UPI0037835727
MTPDAVAAPAGPPELDFEFYRAAHADLSGFDVAGLRRHFDLHGKAEGRAGSPLAYREQFVAAVPRDLDTLEIGPFCAPLLRGEHVFYFDVADREALMRRAAVLQYPYTDAPEIHFVSPQADMSVVDRAFDQLFSSHCVEHQPDLVRHLNEAARVLKPGGRYFLLVPDKRYCFDHFQPATSLADALGAHVEGRRRHSAESLLRAKLIRTHNDPGAHWRGSHGAPIGLSLGDARIREAFGQTAAEASAYADTHAWYFTPESFRDVVCALRRLSLHGLDVERVYNTPFGRIEFAATLRKPCDGRRADVGVA